jgi:hypothetical protein
MWKKGGRSSHMQEDNIKLILEETRYECVGWSGEDLDRA